MKYKIIYQYKRLNAIGVVQQDECILDFHQNTLTSSEIINRLYKEFPDRDHFFPIVVQIQDTQ